MKHQIHAGRKQIETGSLTLEEPPNSAKSFAKEHEPHTCFLNMPRYCSSRRTVYYLRAKDAYLVVMCQLVLVLVPLE